MTESSRRRAGRTPRAPRRPTWASFPTGRTTRPSSSAGRGEAGRHRQPPRRPPDHPLRRRAASARPRSSRPASSTTCARRCAGNVAAPDGRRSRSARSAPGGRTRCPRSWRRSAPRQSRRSAASELPRWRPASRWWRRCAPGRERVRTLLVVLDEFEDYFLYHPRRGRRRDVRRRVPAPRQRAEPARELPALAPRGRAGEARPLQRADPAPLRELPPRRAPRPRGRARGDRAAARRSGTGRGRAGETR